MNRYTKQTPEQKFVKRQARFWSKVRVKAPEECWEWTGSKSEFGYGQTRQIINANGRTTLAHRVSWELKHGPIPNDQWVLHKCDNPPCVNPDHLFIGSQKDNMQDCKSKGRMICAKGEMAGNVILTSESVKAMRQAFRSGTQTMRQLGIQYGVTADAAYRVIRGINWKHIPGAVSFQERNRAPARRLLDGTGNRKRQD